MLVLVARALLLGVTLRPLGRPSTCRPRDAEPRRAVDAQLPMRADGKSVDSLVQMLGERNTERIMRVNGIRGRLADGSLESAIPRLQAQFSISGDALVTFLSNSVAARLGDESFWAALARLRGESGISGDALVSFMGNSVAARLDCSGFMGGVAFMSSELSPLETVALMKNNDAFASRLTLPFARSVVSIVRHLNSHGFV